jgi:hypothetical protein
MRKLYLLLFLTIAVMLVISPASSQINSTAVEAKVDSQFFVGTTQLPAGEYAFTVDAFTHRMRIRNINTHETISVFVQERTDNSTLMTSKLVFLKNEDGVFLHKVRSEHMPEVYDIMHGTEIMELE